LGNVLAGLGACGQLGFAGEDFFVQFRLLAFSAGMLFLIFCGDGMVFLCGETGATVAEFVFEGVARLF